MKKAVVVPTCSCSCGCVPRDVEEALEGMGYNVMGHAIRYEENDFLNAIEETAEALLQKYVGKQDCVLVLCRQMPLTLVVLLAFKAGQGELELRVFHREPITKQPILVNPLESTKGMCIVRQ